MRGRPSEVIATTVTDRREAISMRTGSSGCASPPAGPGSATCTGSTRSCTVHIRPASAARMASWTTRPRSRPSAARTRPRSLPLRCASRRSYDAVRCAAADPLLNFRRERTQARSGNPGAALSGRRRGAHCRRHGPVRVSRSWTRLVRPAAPLRSFPFSRMDRTASGSIDFLLNDGSFAVFDLPRFLAAFPLVTTSCNTSWNDAPGGNAISQAGGTGNLQLGTRRAKPGRDVRVEQLRSS